MAREIPHTSPPPPTPRRMAVRATATPLGPKRILKPALASKAGGSSRGKEDDLADALITPPRAAPTKTNVITKVKAEPIDVDAWVKAEPDLVSPPRIVISDSETDVAPRPPRTPRRTLRDPDSDSESEADVPAPRRPTQTPLRTPSRYLDLFASGSRRDEAQDQAWMEKYYDDSLGSLEDFIVPDDESLESGTESEGESGSEVCESGQEADEHSESESESDADADADASDAGILQYSPPPRLLALPELDRLTLEPSTPRRASKAKAKAKAKATPSKRNWASERTRIAQDIFNDLDKRVFEGKLGKAGAGATLEWNNRLLTTAGTANSKWTKHSDGSKTETVKIVLSEKVLTGEEQILSTVAHEMCHLAAWVISNERKNPHGRVFKSWGRKVMRARKDIEVTTKHGYEIEYKYSWRCTSAGCDKIYQRHSKSIDINKQACGRCKGKLEPMFETRETAFQAYLKTNMALAKAAMPGAPHGEVMRALSKRWTEGEGDHAEYWRGLRA